MSLFDQTLLNPGVRKREVFGWAMYDFANSGYTTVVLTAVFNAYFVGVVAGNAPWATLAWTLALAGSNLLVIALQPALGAWADRHGAKKRLLAAVTAGCVLATALLAAGGRGDVALALAAVLLSNAFYSAGESLCAAFLPELSTREAMGRVSGWGWSFGYCGGMLTLGLCLAYVLWAQGQGQPATQFVPVTMGITAGVYGLASLVTFALLKERARPQPGAAQGEGIAASLRRLRATWQTARAYPDFAQLLACTVAYQAGIAVVVALAAVYAEQALGFVQTQTMTLLFVVNIASAAGAFAFGYWQDRVGHKRALGWTLVGWIGMTALALAATTPGLFWAAALLAGLCMGSSQSAGRALVGLLAPPARLGEFFGLWTFATRLAAIAGPVTYGLVTWLTGGNHRLAIGVTGLFFVLGLVLLRPLDLRRGQAAAV
ncbi:MFS transporter [Azohydromonas caseinilytica]|uniref:MFS transporter n=1 Tax=Azohydromonas caseinilytica TaxID=2728836 RepID=A0A848F571_9BURK|nr:MFS transporter [Azohydromonas caseinilytica]NML14258.1 MFS transporter [Azohydromonas caseinilytica]